MTTCNFEIGDNFLCDISKITTTVERISLQYIINSIQTINDNIENVLPSITPTPTSSAQPNKVLYNKSDNHDDDYYEFTITVFCLLLGLLLLNIYKCIKKNRMKPIIKHNSREKQIITNPMYRNAKV